MCPKYRHHNRAYSQHCTLPKLAFYENDLWMALARSSPVCLQRLERIEIKTVGAEQTHQLQVIFIYGSGQLPRPLGGHSILYPHLVDLTCYCRRVSADSRLVLFSLTKNNQKKRKKKIKKCGQVTNLSQNQRANIELIFESSSMLGNLKLAFFPTPPTFLLS